MAIFRRDDTIQNTLGNAIAGASVYYLTQPANTSALMPLASVYSDTSGTAAANPQQTDGSGHAVAYLTDGQLYTIVYVYPNGTKVVYPDQFVGSSSGASTSFAGVPAGTVNGTNTVFTLTNGGTPLAIAPIAGTVTAWQNFPLINGLGFSLDLGVIPATITYATAPQSGDSLYAQGLLS
jgi:hypothetical protein